MLNPDAWHSGSDGPRAEEPDPGVLDDLAAAVWVQAYDAAWLGRNWPQLQQQLAADVALLSPDRRVAVAGRRAVLAHMRATLRDAQVHEYNATDLKGRSTGGVGIISYRWQLDWTVGHRRQQLSGRDVLVLRAAATGWQLVRRLPVGA
ncbi:MAG: nuclear transport factor 2 family protein [Steroidobacteraceae bacterium]